MAKDYIKIFNRKAIGFHGQANFLELNFFMRKKIFKMVKPGRQNHSHSQSIHLMLGLNETPVVPLSLQIYIIVRVT